MKNPTAAEGTAAETTGTTIKAQNSTASAIRQRRFFVFCGHFRCIRFRPGKLRGTRGRNETQRVYEGQHLSPGVCSRRFPHKGKPLSERCRETRVSRLVFFLSTFFFHKKKVEPSERSVQTGGFVCTPAKSYPTARRSGIPNRNARRRFSPAARSNVHSANPPSRSEGLSMRGYISPLPTRSRGCGIPPTRPPCPRGTG